MGRRQLLEQTASVRRCSPATGLRGDQISWFHSAVGNVLKLV
jgi:hypothetical protein